MCPSISIRGSVQSVCPSIGPSVSSSIYGPSFVFNCKIEKSDKSKTCKSDKSDEADILDESLLSILVPYFKCIFVRMNLLTTKRVISVAAVIACNNTFPIPFIFFKTTINIQLEIASWLVKQTSSFEQRCVQRKGLRMNC